MTVSKPDQAGFTLVEAMIVLALVSIIIGVVLLAVGGAQVSRRDMARKDAVNRLLASILQAGSSNNGSYPICDSTDANSCPVPAGWNPPAGLVIGACYCSGGNSYVEWGSYNNPNPAKNCNTTSSTLGYLAIKMESDGSYYCRTY